MSLHPEELARVIRVLGVVLDEPKSFTEFEWGFASNMAKDIDQQGRAIVLSPKQRDVIDRIERKVEELGR